MTSPANSLKFGTSGLRGLVTDLQGNAARRYTAAFLRYLSEAGEAASGKVYLGRDFRPSSPDILADCAAAITAAGMTPIDCGAVPTPALALHAMTDASAAIMVTGSHIPADRNGLKFYVPSGEISKADEAGILAALQDDDIDGSGYGAANEFGAATERYIARFEPILPIGALNGLRVGVYEHSTVARDMLHRVLRHHGAETLSLGRRADFVPVDTEAFGDAVFAPLLDWLKEHELDAIVSADGDGDRPLFMDNQGAFVRGDVLGLLTAKFCAAKTVVTPVTSNSAIERTGLFETVVRTRVGSPYVVAELNGAVGPAIGFEANGGTFVGQGVIVNDKRLAPLETRDAVLPILAVLGLAAAAKQSVAEIVAALPLQHALADRLQDVSGERSGAFLKRLGEDRAYAEQVFAPHGISDFSDIDGLQFRTSSGDMVHFRASGNAPELRVYVEGSSPERAADLLAWGLDTASQAVR
jgi:phosphomannomutase